MLNQLRKVHLEAFASRKGEGDAVRVHVRNPSDHLAFQIHLSIVEEKSGEEILPVLWEDNYFSLMPGESREIAARYEMPLSVGGLKLEVDGWNLDTEVTSVDERRMNTTEPGKGAN
jgi:exo-1,4-beta-D-glucosaminidase